MRYLIPALFILGSLFDRGSSAQAELPEKLQKAIAKAEANLAEQYAAANEKLLAAFDKRIEDVRKAPKLSADARQTAIANLEAEKAICAKSKWVPFSPNMRSAAIAYLNTVQKAEIELAKAFDLGIDFYTNGKEDALARELLESKRSSLKPNVVGKFSIRIDSEGGKPFGAWTLFSDGTAGKGISWTLDAKNLVRRVKDPNAPGGAWIDTAVVTDNGRELRITNQIKTRMSGTLSVQQ